MYSRPRITRLLKNKTHIFFPDTTALILCNQFGDLLKALDINEVSEHIYKHGEGHICKRCLSIYLKSGKKV